MGADKEKMMQLEAEEFQKQDNKMNGYRKKLLKEGEYSNMDCPYCEAPLSKTEIRLPECHACNSPLFGSNEK